jgi:transcriptional regulator with XRE-family HTH domain
MTWQQYVVETIGSDLQVDAANKTGLDQGTISRWAKREPSSLSLTAVRKFAEGYGRDVLGAFIAAGFLSDVEAGVVLHSRSMPVSQLDDAALSRELLALAHEASLRLCSQSLAAV